MPNPSPTPLEERAWLGLADHFLDTETRHDLVHSAFRCVEAGYDVERTKAAYFGRVAPLLYSNLLSVAGEWAGWDEAVLLERMRARVDRPGFLSEAALRVCVPGVDATIEAVARFVAFVSGLPEASRNDYEAALGFLGEIYFDFGTSDPETLSPNALALVDGDARAAFTEAIAPALIGRDRRDGEMRLARLDARLRNRRAAGVSVRPLLDPDASWREVLGLGFELDANATDRLRSNYAHGVRAYHDLSHVVELFGHFHRVTTWEDPTSVALAILFHDAIYDPSASDNEARSATTLSNLLRGTALAEWVPRARDLVLLTARHGALSPADVDRDAARFLDCDLAILGAPPDRFDAYEAAIAAEHANVPARVYRHGRRAFVERMLARPRIFLSDEFHERFDAAARANLTRSIASLRG